MAIIKKKMIIFPKIEIMTFIIVPTGGDKMPDLRTNKAILISGPMTGGTFPLELTGTILDIWGPLLEHQGFLLQVEMLPNILLVIQKNQDVLTFVITIIFSNKQVLAILNIVRVL